MNNYSITFKSLRAGTVYTLNIGGGTGAAIPLKGGAQPFTTQEDDSEDMFTPIRTQTGYIRIVDDGKDARTPAQSFDWEDLLPATDTSRPVTLTNENGSVLWEGFIKPINFGGVLYGNPQVREFPVQCPLSVLESEYIDKTITEVQNFAYVLYRAFNYVVEKGITLSYVFQGGADAREWLKMKVDWQNFVDLDSDGELVSKYDYLQVVTDVCNFWGWSVRCSGQEVYFSCVDDSSEPNALVLSHSELFFLATNEDYTPTGIQTFGHSITLNGGMIVSNDNEETLIRGIRKASVHADFNAEKTIISLFPSSVVEQMDSMQGLSSYDQDLHVSYSPDMQSFDTPLLSGVAYSPGCSFNIAQHDEDNPYTVIHFKESYGSGVLATISTKFEHCYNGVSGAFLMFLLGDGLRLSGEIRSKDGKVYTGDAHFKYAAGIGKTRSSALWYMGSGLWLSQYHVITTGLNSDGSWDNGLLFTGEASTQKLIGNLYIDFYGSDDMPEYRGQRKFDISNFTVKYVGVPDFSRFTTEERAVAEVAHYTANSSGNSRNEWDRDLVYASDNNGLFGYGIVHDKDGNRLEKISYGGVNEHPEQHLVDRVSSFMATSKKLIDVDLNANMLGTCYGLNPRSIVTFESRQYYPISINREWRDDVLRAKLISL